MDDLELYHWVATNPKAGLAVLFGQASEFLIGGKTDPLLNKKPEHPDGLGGVVRGLAAGASARLSDGLKESSPSTLSEAGADAGETLVPVAGRVNRVVTGTTLTGKPVDRTVEAAMLATELVPLAAPAASRVGVLLQTTRARFGKVVTQGAQSTDTPAYLGMEFLDDGLRMLDNAPQSPRVDSPELPPVPPTEAPPVPPTEPRVVNAPLPPYSEADVGRVAFPRGRGASTGPLPEGYVSVSRWVDAAEAEKWLANGGTKIPGDIGAGGRVYVTAPGATKPGGTGPIRVDFSLPGAALGPAGRSDWSQILQQGRDIPILNVSVHYPRQ
jgi:hypothetical protein